MTERIDHATPALGGFKPGDQQNNIAGEGLFDYRGIALLARFQHRFR